jgi:hypothetical protein
VQPRSSNNDENEFSVDDSRISSISSNDNGKDDKRVDVNNMLQESTCVLFRAAWAAFVQVQCEHLVRKDDSSTKVTT